MNGLLPEIMQSLNPSSGNSEMSVLERQRAYIRSQQQESINTIYFNDEEQLMGGGFLFGNNDQGLGELLVGRAMKPDPGMGNGWNDDDFLRELSCLGNGSEFEIRSCPLPRTASCPPSVAAAMAEVVAASRGKEAALSSATTGNKENARKRKADKPPNLKVIAEEKSSPEKKMKGCGEEHSSNKDTEQVSSVTTVANEKKKGNSTDNSKENSKVSEVPKPDYIHVRARRGQATDSHSLAERVRREKISERMKYLQDLVPGCNKITGKAGMLDEIINYVQSLQKQVEFLSMKLAAVNPTLDFEIDNYAVKEMFPCSMGMSSCETVNLEFNAITQGVPSCMDLSPPDVALRRTISAPPVPIPNTFLDSSSLNQIQTLPWDAELQSLQCMEFQQGVLSTSFISQPFTGYSSGAGQVKLEM